jgi:Protein affecting phage T7 exclusion by the F pla smid
MWRGYDRESLCAPTRAACLRGGGPRSIVSVFLILLLVFIVTPIAEIYLIVQVADVVGGLNTVALLILVSVIGAAMVKREGMGILARAQSELALGRVPGRELVDGLLVLFAGVLMLTPGFATDALGLSLLFPPTRALIRGVVSRGLSSRAASQQPVSWHFGYRGGGNIVEAQSTEVDPGIGELGSTDDG